MLPDYAITGYIEKEPSLCHLPFHALYQHEIKSIGTDFPYKKLNLSQVGIPPWSILHVHTEKGTRYVELADEQNYITYLFQNEQI